MTAQVAVYRAALATAGVDAHTVGMVEAHGTGTPVGDPVEYTSLAQVYGIDGPCALGSVKTNFGHTQSAAGALGLMKTVLALQHGEVPRNLHFTRLPDDLARIETNLFVPQASTPWPTNGRRMPRRAAVSSYGISGTNVHAIVEQAPVEQVPDTVAPHIGAAESGTVAPLLFAVSSTSADALGQTAARLVEWVQEHADSVVLSDLAYTLARRRAHRPVRAAVIAGSVEELTDGLRQIADGDTTHQGRGGARRPGPGVVVLRARLAVGGDGRGPVGRRTRVRRRRAEVEPLVAAESGFSVTEAMTAPQP